MLVQPYLFFEGRCAEALEFYTKVLGAKVDMKMLYSESPEPGPPGMPPGYEKKIMHAAFRIGETTLMGSDGMCSGQPGFKGFSLSVSAADEAEAKRVYSALSEGGQQQMPLTKTFFSPAFGMLVDKFGVSWMVMVATQ
jgi:PhnB protein